jgi:hypothetical protein
MENEITSTPQPEQTPLELPNESQFYLWETRKWGNFLGILGFIFVGLMVLGGIGMGMFSSALREYGNLGFPGFGFTLLYLLMALLYFFPILYIYRFSSHMKIALQTKSADELNLAFKNLKSNFRFVGILCIVVLSIYALILLFVLIFAGTLFSH